MEVVLLRGLSEDGSWSMRRYARELAGALLTIGDPSIQVREFAPRTPVFAQRLMGRAYGKRLDSALERYVNYPRKVITLPGDVYHVLDHGYGQVVCGLDASRTVVTVHDVIPMLASTGVIPMQIPKTVALTFGFRLKCAARAAMLISDSEATKKEVVRFTNISPDRVAVVPLGVSALFRPADDPCDRATVRRMLGLPEKAPVVLHVGGAAYKNRGMLVRVICKLRQATGGDIRLILIGPRLSRAEIDGFRQEAVEPFVTCRESIKCDDELLEYYHSADVLAFPSMWEGFGWPPLEAMASGLPVVAARAGALVEVVGDAGVLVEPCDEEGFGRAIWDVLTLRLLRDMLVERGLKRCRMYSWETTAISTIQVYKQVAKAGAPRLTVRQ